MATVKLDNKEGGAEHLEKGAPIKTHTWQTTL